MKTKDLDLKKTEECSKLLEAIKKTGSNKQCFDCGEKGTTYVAVNFGTFICSRCAGIHRELNFKVKGTGVSTFTEKDIELVTRLGNDNAKLTWMGKFKEKLPDAKDTEAVRKHIKAKYVDKKYYVKNPDGEKEKKKDKKASSEESSESEEEETKKPTKTKAKEVSAPKPSEVHSSSKLKPLSIKTTVVSGPSTAGAVSVKNPDGFEFLDTKTTNSKNTEQQASKSNANPPQKKESNDWGDLWAKGPTVTTTTTTTTTATTNTSAKPPMEINLITAFQGTNNPIIVPTTQTAPNTKSTSATSTDMNMKALSESLSSAYQNSGSNQMTNTASNPNTQMNLNNPSNATNFMNLQQTNMLGVSNNIYMSPQMMQQMMMNPQIMQNPQMMQMMMQYMMMQNMQMNQMGMGFNPIPCGQNVKVNDMNYGMSGGMNVNLSAQQQSTVTKPADEEKYDAFKDIYNYSKQKKGSDAPVSTKTTTNTQNQTGGNTNYNPFDFD